MKENETSDLVPFQEDEGTRKYPLRKICVKVYLNEREFIEWIRLAEEAGIRPRGLKPFRQKPHGFSFERLANTKGLVKFLKRKVVPYWKDGAKDRAEREARLKREAEELGLQLKKG